MKTIHINFCVEHLENRLLLSQGAVTKMSACAAPLFLIATKAVQVSPTVSPSSATTDNSGAFSFDVGNLSSARQAPVTVTLGKKVFFAGGTSLTGTALYFQNFDTVDIYDSASQTWSVHHLSVARYAAAAAAVGNKIIIGGGGDNGGKGVDIYDSSTNTWSTASLSVPRSGGSAATIGQKVYFAGLENFPTRIVDVYDDAINRWTTIRAPRKFMDSKGRANTGGTAGAAIGEQAIFLTGDIVQVFNATTSKWHVFKLRHPMLNPKATTVGSKAIFSDDNGSVVTYDDLTGGIDQNHIAILSRPGYGAAAVGQYTLYAGDGLRFSNVIDIHNNLTGVWTTAVLSIGRGQVVGASVGNTALFAGGITNDPISQTRVYTSTVDIVHIDTSLLTGGLTGRPGHTVTVQVFNTGDAPLASGAVVKLYATQARGIIDGSSILLGSKSTTSALAASDNRTLRVSTKIPGTMAGGSYYLVAAVDDGRTVTPIASSETTYRVGSKATPAIIHRVTGAFTRIFRR